MTELKITPVAKPRMTRRDVWSKRLCVSKYYRFKDKLIKLAKEKRFKLADSYKVEFLMPMPASWSISKKVLMSGKPHQSRPDLDNLLKAVNDCLLKEDSTVWFVEASKIWWDEGKIIFYNK
jgi:Holliday junction resolvase RusA-like endonuclease